MSESWIVGINLVEGVLSNDVECVCEVLVEQGQCNVCVQVLVEQVKVLKILVYYCLCDQLDKLVGEVCY